MSAFLFCILIPARSKHSQNVFQLFRILLFFVGGGLTSTKHAFSKDFSFPFDVVVLIVVTSSLISPYSNAHALLELLFVFPLFSS